MNDAPHDPAARFLGWRMVAIAALCINVGLGFTFGAYGTFMSSMTSEFAASRSLASGGVSLLVATMGLCAPAASYAVRRWSIRAALIAGCILMSIGWGLVSVAASAWHYVLGFGVVCGAAAACLTAVPPMTLINNWFIAFRGRALGIATIAIMLTVVPSLASAGITTFGWRATALTIAVIALLCSPLMLFVIDRPEAVGQRALGAELRGDQQAQAKDQSGARESGFLSDPIFWILLLGWGFCAAAAASLSTHLVPFALGRGLDLGRAASLASIFGAAALIGSLVGGVIVDRIGGARTFAIIAFAQFAIWPCLLLPYGYYFLAVCVALIGLCANSIAPALMALITHVFGRERFARAMGLLSVCATPLKMMLPLLAGALYDLSGSYSQMLVIYAAMFGLVGVTFCLLARIESRRQARATAAAQNGCRAISVRYAP